MTASINLTFSLYIEMSESSHLFPILSVISTFQLPLLRSACLGAVIRPLTRGVLLQDVFLVSPQDFPTNITVNSSYKFFNSS